MAWIAKSRSVYRLVASWLHMPTQFIFLALPLSSSLPIRKEKVNEVNTWKQGAKYKITHLVQRNKHISASMHTNHIMGQLGRNATFIIPIWFQLYNMANAIYLHMKSAWIPSNSAEDIAQIFLLILLCTSKTSFNHKYLFSGVFEVKLIL